MNKFFVHISNAICLFGLGLGFFGYIQSLFFNSNDKLIVIAISSGLSLGYVFTLIMKKITKKQFMTSIFCLMLILFLIDIIYKFLK